MRRTFQHIAIYLLTSVVLIASTGLSIHHLYCICKGEVVASLFRPDDPCEMMAETDDCCRKGVCESAKKEQHDCADCQSEYVVLDADYLLSSGDFKVNAPTSVYVKSFNLPQVAFIVATKINWDQDIPPPAGKALLPWIQSFLC